MALTVDEIAEIINSMREENESNTQAVERVLTGINNKLCKLLTFNITIVKMECFFFLLSDIIVFRQKSVRGVDELHSNK